jgi:hypothetical protein
MEQDEAARMAKSAGVTRLLEEHPQSWQFAVKSAAALIRAVPKDLAPAEESAHAFRVEARPEDKQ